MKKRVILIPLVILLLAGGGFLIYKSLGSLDQLIKSAVENVGSDMLQAKVKLGGVSLDIQSGEAGLTGLFVGNPAGYKTDYAMKLEQLKLTLDLESLTSDTILVKEVLVQAPALIYEKKDGVSKFDALLKNVKDYTGSGGGGGKAPGNDDSPKLIIEDLYINDASAAISYQIMQGKTLSVNPPNIHLRDIGKDKGGATPAEVVSEVIGQMTGGISTALGGVVDGAGKVLEKGKEGIKNVGDKLKGIFD